MVTIPLTLFLWSHHLISVFYILLQAWSLLFTRSVTEVSCPICGSGRLLIEGLRPFLLQTEWLRLDDTKDMVVPCCPWQVLHRDLCGFMHSKYLKGCGCAFWVIWRNLLIIHRIFKLKPQYLIYIHYID